MNISNLDRLLQEGLIDQRQYNAAKSGNRLNQGVVAKDPFSMRSADEDDRDLVRRLLIQQGVEDQRGGGNVMVTPQINPSAGVSPPVENLIRLADTKGVLSGGDKQSYMESLTGSPSEVRKSFREDTRPKTAIETNLINDSKKRIPIRPTARIADPDMADSDMTDDTVTADAEEVELDLEGMAPSQQTLLQRIGNALKNNPELAASGAQLIGGLVSNVAQNRAQRRADRTTDQRVARANLISAITGGRARPTVERAQADTGGFMSLDTLGKAFQGGGAAVKGELSRRVEEAERERKAGLDERAAGLDERAAELAENRLELTKTANKNTEDYRNKITQIKEDELRLRRDIFDAENNKQPVGGQLSDGKILEFSSRIQAVAKTDELTDFLKDANLSFLEKGQFSFKNVPQLLFGGNAAEAEARRQNLIQAMAESYGGKLSNQDVERIDKQLFTQRDNLKTSLQVAEVFRNTLVGSLERDLRLLEEGGFDVSYIQKNLYETDQGQSESDADRLGSMLSDNPLDRISRQ